MYTTLDEYFTHIMSTPFMMLNAPVDGMHMYSRTTGVVLHRDGQFQTELFLVPFGVEKIEFHIHPNVDSYELPLSGEFTLESNKIGYPSGDTIKDTLFDRYYVNIPHNHVHGAAIQKGAAFLSFQYWLNGVKPTSVIKDYILDINDPRLADAKNGLDEKVLEEYKKNAKELTISVDKKEKG